MKNATDIFDYLVNIYCSNEAKGNYASLINGPWGCGKTYVINDFIKFVKNKKDFLDKYAEPSDENSFYIKYHIDANKNKIEKTSKKKIIYVSLYGASSVKEVSNSVNTATKGMLKRKLTIFGKTLHGALSTFSAYGVIKNGIDALSIALREDNPNGKKVKVKKKTMIIFDDLERVNYDAFSFIEFMGYINALLMSKAIVVCVCCEDKITEHLKAKNEKTGIYLDDYKEFKRKTFHNIQDINATDQQVIKQIIGPDVNISNFQLNQIVALIGNNIRTLENAKIVLDQMQTKLKSSDDDKYQKLIDKYSFFTILSNCIRVINFVYIKYQGTNIEDLKKKDSNEGRRVESITKQYKYDGFDLKTKNNLMNYFVALHANHKNLTVNDGNLILAILYFYENNQDTSKLLALI